MLEQLEALALASLVECYFPDLKFDYAVMAPLDHILKSIEKMVAPHLVEVGFGILVRI